MKHVKKSVLLWYTPREMHDLVTAIPRYPEFLPWCDRAEVLETHEDGVTARVGLSIAGVRQSFSTRNTHEGHERVAMRLVDGPFSVLEGDWTFLPLAAGPGQAPQACKVEFELHYAFSSAALEAVVSPVFDRIAATFVDSFVKRAEVVYGPR
ncbi:MAG TPA: type II toxin-antitoxin system RatA family toxin [Burkholderiaceae bacterium]|nr:type II toxin-antitoxin system RatA family toxin [Burkholderiaceae bacterium]